MPFSIEKRAKAKVWNFPQGPVNFPSSMPAISFELQEPFFSYGIHLAPAFILSTMFLSNHFQTVIMFYGSSSVPD